METEKRNCPVCGEPLNGEQCGTCGYSLREDSIHKSEKPYHGIPFPRNIITTPCYIAAAIFVILLLMAFAGSMTSPMFVSSLFIGIVCILIAIGKGVSVIYMALESIEDRLRHIDNGKEIDNEVPLDKKQPESVEPITDSQNIGYMTFRVAGVTYNNDDGTSRQEIIAEIRRENNPTENKLDFKEYSYEGKPALAVYLRGKQVGNVPANRVDYLLEEIEKNHLVSAELEFLGGGDLSYGVEITLGILKE